MKYLPLRLSVPGLRPDLRSCLPYFPGNRRRIPGSGRRNPASGAAYIRGLGAGALPIIISQVLMAFTKTDGSPRLGLYSIIVMTVINITLDFCNVLFFHLGMFGMAMATSISYFAAVFICLIHFFKPVNSLRFVRVKNPFRELCTIGKTGFPNALNKICITARTALTNHVLMLLTGDVALTAFSIQNSLNSILGSICTGIGATTLLISGIFLRRRRQEDPGGFRQSINKNGSAAYGDCLCRQLVVFKASGDDVWQG